MKFLRLKVIFQCLVFTSFLDGFDLCLSLVCVVGRKEQRKSGIWVNNMSRDYLARKNKTNDHSNNHTDFDESFYSHTNLQNKTKKTKAKHETTHRNKNTES